MKISAVIITYNEEKHIGRCLESLSGLTDEIIVVDSFSSDKTPEICQNYQVKFVQKAYEGQIEQKNFALSLTNFSVILALDGDEALDGELRQSIIEEKILGFPEDGYFLNRMSLYCNQWIKHGNWFPDYKLRLWHKNRAVWSGVNPHDRVTLTTRKKPAQLRGKLLHYTFDSVREHQQQTMRYAEISAQSYQKSNVKWATVRMIVSPVFYFVKSYIFKVGFLDGTNGWRIARLEMWGKFLKYRRLSQLRNRG